ncbi:hypothetical protein [Bradyrhizobium sp. STM 3843]|nr:hypothetical protein [Bradyrhizobium sp. STM 3843]
MAAAALVRRDFASHISSNSWARFLSKTLGSRARRGNAARRGAARKMDF